MKVLFFAIIIFIGAVGCSSSRPDIENNDVITISLPELPEKRLDDIDIKLVRLETIIFLSSIGMDVLSISRDQQAGDQKNFCQYLSFLLI